MILEGCVVDGGKLYCSPDSRNQAGRPRLTLQDRRSRQATGRELLG